MKSTTPGERASRLWGQGISKLFPAGSAPTTVVPWPSGGRRKAATDYDASLVRLCLTQPPWLDEIDPRRLWATQPGITHAGVEYYLNDPRYRRLGRTYADREKLSNAYPLIYRRDDGQNLILGGHHRSAAALLRGSPVLALITSGPWGGLR